MIAYSVRRIKISVPSCQAPTTIEAAPTMPEMHSTLATCRCVRPFTLDTYLHHVAKRVNCIAYIAFVLACHGACNERCDTRNVSPYEALLSSLVSWYRVVACIARYAAACL